MLIYRARPRHLFLSRSLDSPSSVHFIGAGGIGMSALARILLSRGHQVSGSDRKMSPAMEALQSLGMLAFASQTANNFDELKTRGFATPLVVISSAIPESNAELAAARQLQLTVWHRSDLLAALIDQQPSIAVAGSHGKTTTSTVVTSLLHSAGEDPTAVIGGIVPCYGSNGHAGSGRLLVAEADESDGSLVKFNATLGVITNLELDHTDHYRDLDDLITTMRRFAAGCGRLLANQDDPILSEHFQADAWWSVQRSDNVDFAALPVALEGDHTVADLYEQAEYVGRITLPLPGLHNLSNALGALAACRLEGIPLERLVTHLNELKTPGRRFDYRGDWQGRLVVDDYAHHPSEVAATLAMAALMVSSGRSPLPRSPKRLLAVFQPHRYSRTREFQNEFAVALSNVDIVVLAPVFSAGETPIPGVSSEALASCIQQHNVDQTVLVADTMDELADLVREHSCADDLVLAMGAGDVNSLWSRLSPNALQEQTSCQSTLTA